MKPLQLFLVVLSVSCFQILPQVDCLKGKNNKVVINPGHVSTSGHPVYQFATKLFDQVAQEKQSSAPDSNILISPFSIRTALAIISLGAKGECRSDTVAYLSYNIDKVSRFV